MSDLKASKADIEKVRDLFGLAHDLLAQAQFPGHVSPKVTEVMQFLAYQFNDFKQRAAAIATVVADPSSPGIPDSAPTVQDAVVPGEAAKA